MRYVAEGLYDLLKRSSDFIIYSSIFIGIIGIALTLSSYLILNGSFNGISPCLLCLVFFGSLLIYNLNVLSGLKSHWLNKKDQWKEDHAILMKILLLGSGLILIWSMQFFSFRSLLFISHLGIISILYVLPVKYENRYYSLRMIPLAKIFFLSYVWASMTVIVPFFDQGGLGDIKVIQLFLERFMFVFALTIPFDVRDLLRDKKEALKTLPMSIGICRSLQISRVFLIFFVGISFITDGISYVSLTRIICAVIGFVLLDKISLKNKENFYLIGLDGLLILYFLILVSLKYFFS